MNLTSIGKNIRHFRVLKGMKQEDLAEQTNLSTNYIGALERGEKLPALDTFIVIANALGVSSDLLLFEVLDTGYQIKSSLLSTELDSLSPSDRSRIFDVIDVLIQHSSSAK